MEMTTSNSTSVKPAGILRSAARETRSRNMGSPPDERKKFRIKRPPRGAFSRRNHPPKSLPVASWCATHFLTHSTRKSEGETDCVQQQRVAPGGRPRKVGWAERSESHQNHPGRRRGGARLRSTHPTCGPSPFREPSRRPGNRRPRQVAVRRFCRRRRIPPGTPPPLLEPAGVGGKMPPGVPREESVLARCSR